MRLKLAKMLQAFGEQNTDNGILMYEGELAIDVEVFIQDEAGEVVPAPDGEYKSEDGKVIVVSGGKVTELKDAEKPAEEEAPVEQAEEPIEEAPKEEPQPDKVAELEAIIAEKSFSGKWKGLNTKLTEADIKCMSLILWSKYLYLYDVRNDKGNYVIVERT